MQKFKPGDLVKLKPGDGPTLTVCGYGNGVAIPKAMADPKAGFVRCQWWAGKRLQTDFFVEETLQPASDEKRK